jgi:hypothetical protein
MNMIRTFMIRWWYVDTLGDSSYFPSTSPQGPVRWMTTQENSTTMWVVWDTLSWLIRGTWGVVGFAVVPSMGSGHSTCSTEARCWGSFVLLLLVTLPLGRVTMFIKLEKPNGRLWPLGNLCKGNLVKPYRLTLVVFEGLIDPRQKGITTRGESVQPLQRVRKLVYQSCSWLWAALGAPLIWVTLDTILMMLNDDDYIYGIWYFLLEGVLSRLITWDYC